MKPSTPNLDLKLMHSNKSTRKLPVEVNGDYINVPKDLMDVHKET